MSEIPLDDFWDNQDLESACRNLAEEVALCNEHKFSTIFADMDTDWIVTIQTVASQEGERG